MGIPILVRRRLYIESPPARLFLVTIVSATVRKASNLGKKLTTRARAQQSWLPFLVPPINATQILHGYLTAAVAYDCAMLLQKKMWRIWEITLYESWAYYATRKNKQCMAEDRLWIMTSYMTVSGLLAKLHRRYMQDALWRRGHALEVRFSIKDIVLSVQGLTL